MPETNAEELSSRLETLHPRLKTLFMSGHTEEAVAERGIRPGTRELLEKPFSGTTLARRVRQLLSS